MNALSRLILLCLWLAGCDSHQSPTHSGDAADFAALPSAKLVGRPFVYEVRHGGEQVFRIEALKWRDGHTGAVSVTYDAPWGVNPVFSLATDAALAHGVRMDLEIVSAKLQFYSRRPIIGRMLRELAPNGIGFFGHGHEHVPHDWFGYKQAYESFRTNFDLMKTWGLNPKVYAYPNWGASISTQAANREAGFIAARGGTRRPAQRADYFICPGAVREPDNWYYLPSVIMGAQDGTDIPYHEALVPILKEAQQADAWVILTYHSIGNSEGWGFYPAHEFELDVGYIARSGMWSGNMDAVAAYIQERNALDIKVVRYFGIGTPKQYELSIGDGLDNAVYDEPLTFEFRFNPEFDVQGIRIDPPVEGGSSFAVEDDVLRLNIVPDERRYALVLERGQ